jgi:ElaB/YqjD/DUF883 family membrane-anchored ribosome-binding protein
MSTTTQNAGREGLVDQAKTELGDVASDVQDKAVELKDQGRGKLRETLDRRTSDVGEQAQQAAQVLRQSSTQLASGTQGSSQPVIHLTEMAADQVERFGGYLERASGEELLRDAEDFARRRPWMVAGIGLVAGLAASRFLKASSERRYRTVEASGSAHKYSYSTQSPAGGGYQPATTGGVVTGG